MSFSHRPHIVTCATATAGFRTLLLILLQASLATAQLEANFWLSNAENGPAAPILYVAPDSIQTLDIWGRPETGNLLNAISLNLVAEQVEDFLILRKFLVLFSSHQATRRISIVLLTTTSNARRTCSARPGSDTIARTWAIA